MNISKFYLNNFYLYFLSFKNKTTFKIEVSAITLRKIDLYYLLIKLIIYLVKLNLSKFDLNLLDLNIFLFNIFLQNIYLNIYIHLFIKIPA